MPRVLLIDDEEPIRRMFRTILELAGFSVETEASAHDGVEALTSNNYDVVITDIKMETPTAGFEVVKKATHLKPRPLTVVLTAFPIPQNVWKKAGADALFSKGAGMNLVEQIQKLVRSHRPATI